MVPLTSETLPGLVLRARASDERDLLAGPPRAHELPVAGGDGRDLQGSGVSTEQDVDGSWPGWTAAAPIRARLRGRALYANIDATVGDPQTSNERMLTATTSRTGETPERVA